MGAETKVYVRVLVATEDVLEVDAVTLSEASGMAARLPGVIRVLEASYEPLPTMLGMPMTAGAGPADYP